MADGTPSTRPATPARIVADLGNSRLKWGKVEPDGRISARLSLPTDDPLAWSSAVDRWNLRATGSIWRVSTVNPPLAGRLAQFLDSIGVGDARWYRSADEVPVDHQIDEPGRAGADRALAALAAARRFGPSRSGLVISCGTALTVERVERGVWRGGAIAPGLRAMGHALKAITAQLPEVAPTVAPEAVGRSTIPAIESGLFWGYVGMIREVAARVGLDLEGHDAVARIWTGGDAAAFAPWVDGPSATIAADLVLEGLAMLGAEP